MELTKLQLQKVENYLKHKGIYYEDIKIEILDHLLSDIEDQISNGISFEDAFTNSILKWNTHLTYSSSFYIGYAYSKPKFVIEKLKTFMKWHTLKVIVTLPILFIVAFLKVEISLKNPVLIDSFLRFALYGTSFLILLGYAIILKSKIKTSYRFVYETQVLGYLFYPLVLGDSLLNKSGNIDGFILCIILTCIFVFRLGLKVYRKHLKFVKIAKA